PPDGDPDPQLPVSQPRCTMVSLRPSQWPLILVHMLLLQLQMFQVQGGAHLELRTTAHQKLRRLDEQFQQFQALTQARLDMLALNQNRNSSGGLESRVQVLADQYQRISQDMERLEQSTTQEMEALREWSRKLEKKSKRMEGRMALLERNLRDYIRRHTQKQKPDLGQDFSNLTLELQSREERLVFLEAQRDELLIGLKGLQDSLKNQELRVNRLEGRLGEVLQGNGGGYGRGSGRTRDPITSNVTPQEYYETRRRNQTPRGGRPGRILDRHTQPRPQDTSYSQSTSRSQAPPEHRSSLHPYQHQAQPTPNQPKRSKAQYFNKMLRPQPETQPQPNLEPQTQFQDPNRKPQSADFRPQPEPHQPQQQQHPQIQTQPYPSQQEHHSQLQPQPHQSVPYLPSQIQPQGQHPSQPHTYPQTNPQSQGPSYPSRSEHYYQPQSQAQPQPKPTEDRRMRTRLRTPPPQPTQPQLYPNLKPQLQSESYRPQANKWRGGEEEGREAAAETSEVQNILQLPVRQKIPAWPVPKKDATICNVDSMLFFPSASVENYVTFSLSFPDLPELSVCLWLRVESGRLGTLLSYATDDNDNQLVLYGRDASASSSSPPSSSASSPAFSPPSSPSSPSLDFVVGDPVYRRLAAASLLDGRWHHLCVLWSSIQGRFWHYADRRLASSGSSFRKGWEVPGGGSVVLGQEQDTVGGGFDAAEGFAGRLAGFRVWDRVLSSSEVEGVAEGRGVPRGVVLGMEDIKEVHGEVQQVACECLEHCV
ncbi:uncharacterized protein ptx4, partial [Centroberyx affinis]|uniref:uncharacterized protein ptx4 n=1 Tax=Centroberyx affinis TaxID=166261 RepID=UPI003A5BC4BC